MAITPKNDETIEKLLTYLRDYLNAEAEAFYTAIAEPVKTAVAGVEIGQTDLAATIEFPLLMGYRTTFSGGLYEYSEAVLDYFLLVDVSSRIGQDAIFTWSAKQIAIALDDYNDTDGACLQILEKGKATIRYAKVKGRNGLITIPFLRIPFRFEDYERPAPL